MAIRYEKIEKTKNFENFFFRKFFSPSQSFLFEEAILYLLRYSDDFLTGGYISPASLEWREKKSNFGMKKCSELG